MGSAVQKFLEIAGRFATYTLAQIFRAECLGCRRWSDRPICRDCWSYREVVFVAGSRVQTVLAYREPWRSLMHRIKFQNHRALLRHMEGFCRQSDLSHLPRDTRIVPVPMHASTFRRRGFNPAEILAEQLSRAHGLPLDCDGLVKRHATQLQSLSTDEQRLINPKVVYRFRGRAPRSVLLVDDVVTTGATLAAAEEALVAAGAKEVYLWALFRAERRKEGLGTNRGTVRL